MTVEKQMPQYLCNKKVGALKIKDIVGNIDGSATLTPEDTAYAPFVVDRYYVKTHEPQAGGYYVVYKDGYQSFSPADIFENGYYLL